MALLPMTVVRTPAAVRELAMLAPNRPLELFVIVRILSMGSAVPPAVMIAWCARRTSLGIEQSPRVQVQGRVSRPGSGLQVGRR